MIKLLSAHPIVDTLLSQPSVSKSTRAKGSKAIYVYLAPGIRLMVIDEKELIGIVNCKLSCTSCSLIDQLHPIEKPLFLEISPKLFFMLPVYPPLSLRQVAAKHKRRHTRHRGGETNSARDFKALLAKGMSTFQSARSGRHLPLLL